MSVRMSGCSVASSLFLVLTHGRVIDFEVDSGATPGGSASTEVAVNNTRLLNESLAALQAGDELFVPNSTYLLMGGAVARGLTNCTILIDGTLRFSDDTKAWPTNGKMPVTALSFSDSTKLTLTSGSQGTLDGQGAAWWGLPGIGYLERGKNRPPLMAMTNVSGLIVEHLLFLNSPRFNFISSALVDATIRYCEVSARRTPADSHGAIDLTAFNTDGFDVAGRNIHVHDCTVWNQDDTIAIKADGKMDTTNVLVERVHASGVGLTIGSIGANRVRNITFRDVLMHHTNKVPLLAEAAARLLSRARRPLIVLFSTLRPAPASAASQGVYIKFRDSGSRGSISDVLYENVVIDTPGSWPIWIGPAQQDIKSSGWLYNPCHGDPCSLCWPGPFPKLHTTGNCEAVPGLFANITLRNISILNPSTSPGVIFGNDSNPIQGLVFDGVKVTNPPSGGAWGKDYYYCRGVATGVATGDTWPVPPCFKDETRNGGGTS